MSLSDFFLGDSQVDYRVERQLQKIKHYKRLDLLKSTETKNTNVPINSIEKRLEYLEDSMGFMAILLEGIFSKLDEKGVVTKKEIKEILDDIDGLDGIKDGKLNIHTLMLLMMKEGK